MSKILFLNQPTLSHLNVLRNIALQMKGDGHTCISDARRARGEDSHSIFDATFAAPTASKGTA
jgi:hypothetical protein